MKVLKIDSHTFTNSFFLTFIYIPTFFQYFFLMGPHRIKISSRRGILMPRTILIVENKFQKWTCGLLSITSSCCFIWVSVNNTKLNIGNPYSYLKVLLSGLDNVERILLLRLLWSEKSQIYKLAALVLQISTYLKASKIIQSEWLVAIFCLIFYFLGATFAFYFHFTIVIPFSICSFLKFVALIFNDLLACHGIILLLLLITTLWLATQSFVVQLRLCSSDSSIFGCCRNLDFQFQDLVKLSTKINKLIGHYLTCFIIETVLFLSINLEGVLAHDSTHHDWNSLLSVTIYFVVIVSIFLLAANISQKIAYFKSWLHVKKNRELFEKISDVHIILSQIDSHAVSIKASNVFPVTYGLLANVRNFTCLNFY